MINYLNIKKYIPKILKLITVSITIFMLTLAACFVYLSYTLQGKTYIQNFLSDKLSTNLGYQIRLEDIQFKLPFSLYISKLSLADDEGECMKADKVGLQIKSLPIIGSNFIAKKIFADKITLLRVPAPSKHKSDQNNSKSNINAFLEKIEIKKAFLASLATSLPNNLSTSFNGSLKFIASDNSLIFQAETNIKQGLPILEYGIIQLAGGFNLKKNDLYVSYLAFLHPKIKINSESKINFSSKELESTIKINDLDLAKWFEEASGNAELNVKIIGSLNNPIIKAESKLSKVFYKKKKIQSVKASLNANLNQGKWLGNINLLGEESNCNLTLNYNYFASNLGLNNISINYLKNNITGSLNIDTDKLLANGKLQGEFLSLEQISSYLDNPIKGTAKVSAEFSTLRENQRFTSIIKIQDLNSVNALDISFDLFNIKKIATSQSKTQDWQINLKATGIDNMAQAFNTNIGGNLAITNSDKSSEKKLTLGYIKGSYKNILINSANDIVLSIKDNEQKLYLSKLKVGDGEISLKANLKNINSENKIEGDIDLLSDISIISDLLLPPKHLVKGKLNAKLSILGTYDLPLINGKIQLNNAFYNYLPLESKLQNIQGMIAIQNNNFFIEKLNAEDNEKNKLLIRGNADFSNPRNYNYTFAIDVEKFYLAYPNAYGTISANIAFKGDNEAGKLAGNINCHKLEIYIPNRFNNEVPTLNIVKTIPAVNKQEELSKNTNYPINLDLTLQARDRVFIRGWGLDAELKGKLTLKGNAHKPEIIGKLSSIRGRYEEFGKSFKLKQVKLLFEGSVPPSPYLDIVASSTRSGVEIIPTISGPITSPTFRLKSSPDMPQEEALSILLFGKNSTKISAIQAVQLSNSLRKFTSNKSDTFDPMRKIRDAFGLDDITASSEEEGKTSTSVEIEKRISDNIRLKVDKGTNSQSGGTGIEMDLTPNISVESKADISGNNTLGVNWKYNY